jgi:hypothetical protein
MRGNICIDTQANRNFPALFLEKAKGDDDSETTPRATPRRARARPTPEHLPHVTHTMPTAFTTALAPARLAPRRAAPARKRSRHHRIAPIPGSVGAPRAMSQFAFDAARTDAAKTLSDYVSDDDAPWPNATPSRLVTRAVAPRRGSAARPPPRRFNGRYHAHFAPLPTPTTPRDSMPGAVRPSRHEDCVGDWCDETYERTMFANDLALSADNGLLDAPGPARPPRHSIDRARDVVVFMEDGDVEYGALIGLVFFSTGRFAPLRFRARRGLTARIRSTPTTLTGRSILPFFPE